MNKVSRYNLLLLKAVSKRDDEDRLFQELKSIVARVVTSAKKARGWNCRIDTADWRPVKIDKDEFYSITFKFACTPKRAREQSSIDGEMDEMKGVLEKVAPRKNWRVEAVKEKKGDNPTKYVELKTLPKGWMGAFSHLYKREDQIGIVMSAIKAGIQSNWEKRFHSVLFGEPACGKTELLGCLTTIFGESAILKYDATATTQAGAIKDLDNRLELPRIGIIEELEKVDEQSMRWLLGVLDHRAEIRKVNFRQSISRSTKMLWFATVNNYTLFKKALHGAIASRFSNHVYCPAPDLAVLKKILHREVEEVEGNMKWADKALEFATKHRITDPRKVISVCLCGAEDLLTGKYQKMLESTMATRERVKRASDVANSVDLMQEEDD